MQLALLPIALALLWLAAPVQAQTPTPIVAPNAYDFYVKAGQAIVDRQKVDLARSTKPVDLFIDDKKVQHTFTLAEREDLIRRNAEALKSFRQGLNHPFRRPNSGVWDPFAVNSRFRALSRLLGLESDVKAAQNDWSGAANVSLDILHLGKDVAHGVVIDMLVGAAIEGIGQKSLWSLMDRLDAAQATTAARRLAEIIAAHPTYAATLESEKAVGLKMLRDMMNEPSWKMMRAGKDIDKLIPPGETITLEDRKRWEEMRQTSDQQFLDDYIAGVNQLIDRARRPYSSQPPDIVKPAFPMSTVSVERLAAPGSRFAVERNAAQNALLLAALGLRADKAERGVYPASLTELTPRYLSRVPRDPFGDYAELRYRRDGEKYLLYSIGPDGQDDGGQPCQTKREWVDPQTKLTQTSILTIPMLDCTGDIVAGVNS